MRFYEQITGIAVTMYTEDSGELKTPACTVAMGSTRTLLLFGGDVARPAENHTTIIEFRVVQPPTTMPWGKPFALIPGSGR